MRSSRDARALFDPSRLLAAPAAARRRRPTSPPTRRRPPRAAAAAGPNRLRRSRAPPPERAATGRRRRARRPRTASTIAKLRADYDRLRDELFRARAARRDRRGGLYASSWARASAGRARPTRPAPRRGAPRRRRDLGLGRQARHRRSDHGRRAPDQAGAARADPAARDPPGQEEQRTARAGLRDRAHLRVIVPDGKRTTVEITGDEDGDAARVRAGDRGRDRDGEVISAMLCLTVPGVDAARRPTLAAAARQPDPVGQYLADLEQAGVLPATRRRRRWSG